MRQSGRQGRMEEVPSAPGSLRLQSWVSYAECGEFQLAHF
jgi:hypothetical protein